MMNLQTFYVLSLLLFASHPKKRPTETVVSPHSLQTSGLPVRRHSLRVAAMVSTQQRSSSWDFSLTPGLELSLFLSQMMPHLYKYLDSLWKSLGQWTKIEGEFSLVPFGQIKIHLFLETKTKVPASPTELLSIVRDWGTAPSPCLAWPPQGRSGSAMSTPLYTPSPMQSASSIHWEVTMICCSVTGSGTSLSWLLPRISFICSSHFSEFWDWEWTVDWYPFHLLAPVFSCAGFPCHLLWIR